MITMTALAGTVTAQAQSLRSDSPLWTDETPHTELFPRAFWDDYSFGCQSSLRMGVWQFTPADEPDYPSFWRLQNYGVIHCAMTFGEGSDADAATIRFEDFAWTVRLAKPGDTQLWAIQIGVRGGSRYELLRYTYGKAGFDVLKPKCPPDAIRRQARINIWVQDDCIVASQAQMRRIALEASRRPPAGRLTFIAPAKEMPPDEFDAPEPDPGQPS